jgi:hypothetical protein
MQFSPFSCHLVPLWSKYLLQYTVLKHPQTLLYTLNKSLQHMPTHFIVLCVQRHIFISSCASWLWSSLAHIYFTINYQELIWTQTYTNCQFSTNSSSRLDLHVLFVGPRDEVLGRT